MLRCFAVLICFTTPVATAAQQTTARLPIIDVHLHAYTDAEWRAGLPNPAGGQPAPATAAEHMRRTLAIMQQYNIVAGVVSGPLEAVEAWRQAAPDRVLGSPLFGKPGVDDAGRPLPGVDSLRQLYVNGRLNAMAEVTAQYEGLSPSDSTLEPYFAMAESLDLPVGIHTGTSFPGTPFSGYPNFRVALGNPLLLEDLIVRHPRLRVYIMHGGEPWRRETQQLLAMYPHVYMDIAVIDWIDGPDGKPRFHAFLKEMIEAGFEDRIMFGTDQMRWPDAIAMAIDFVESAPFLTPAQKRKVFYENAARFLGLDREAGNLDAMQRKVDR